MSLHDFLKYKKKYTEDEITETEIRREAGMNLPKDVEEDLKEYVRDYLLDFTKY